MVAQKGRSFLVKIGDGESSETFTTIGAVRANSMVINNNPIDATSMGDNGMQVMIADAGIQSMIIKMDGLFKDDVSEELIRNAAFGSNAKNFQLIFPNGDSYQGEFVIQDYNRSGSYDGLERFSATIIRSGAGVFTAA